MKKLTLTILLTSLFIVGCNNIQESTTNENSSTSFASSSEIVDTNKEIMDVVSNVNLNTINNYEGLTPSRGDIDILLLPIHFSDSKTNMDLSLLDQAFNSQDQISNEWYSVSKFYEISSYNQCHLNFIRQDLITLKNPSTYYTSNYNNANYVYATNEMIKEALESLDEKIDFNDFDSNDDGYIDGIYLVYDHPVDFEYQEQLWWAFTYYFSSLEGYNDITFDNKKVQSYVFAGYDFLSQNSRSCNTNTFIHETAHMFGIDDYYDYDASSGAVSGGLAGGDIMDGTIGDHNAFTKALLSWNIGQYVKPLKELTIELTPFEESGQYIILSNDFVMDKNILQEYFILEYYTPTILNEYEKIFDEKGIRVLHIVATTKRNGTLEYNNTNTISKLISQITTSDGRTYISGSTARSDDTLFIKDEELINVKYLNGDNLQYKFKVLDLQDDKATLLITNKKGD